MPGLLGRKLGMTQVFDAEDGHVERVTVVEAGPCWVTGHPHRGARRLRGRAARVRRHPREEDHQGRAGPPCRRPTPRRCAAWRSSATTWASSSWATRSRRATCSRRATGEGVRRLEGQGLPGHGQAAQLQPWGPMSHGSHNKRAPGLDRRLGHALARVQGHPRPGPDGQQARHPARARGRGRAPRREPVLVRGSVPGPKGAHRRDQDARARRGRSQAPYIGKKTGKVSLDEAVFGEAFHEHARAPRVVAEQNARRRARRPRSPAARSR